MNHAYLFTKLECVKKELLLYQNAVYRQALWILGEVEAAEEAAQEAFLRAFRKLNTFRGGPFKPWVLRITICICPFVFCII
jgi:DNA-directed RNA polymerase specialized sigma24 family protein